LGSSAAVQPVAKPLKLREAHSPALPPLTSKNHSRDNARLKTWSPYVLSPDGLNRSRQADPEKARLAVFVSGASFLVDAPAQAFSPSLAHSRAALARIFQISQ
jgi:hypothetical protein